MTDCLIRNAILQASILILAAQTATAELPPIHNSEPDSSGAPPTPERSLAKFELPTGFKATVFAAEPEVQNPIAMAWDARGRLWIAENFTYAERPKKFDLQLRDRILIFRDRNSQGPAEPRKVFTEEVQRLTSIAIGRGGVWALCPPQLLFIPDRNGDDIPDGPAEVVLDGFTVPAENYHNIANGLRWGPDGWLYGRCGPSAPGELGAPGTPPAARIPLRGGIWRYHPQRRIVEVLTAGPMNTWGYDWDAQGEAFFVSVVGAHFWHLIPGAHFQVGHTLDANPHVYELIQGHADHWHFDTAKGWTASRDGAANDFGGGHAHAGAMIYLGNNWPESYRGHFFTLNLHGHRANQEILERSGSGYVARHAEDAFLFNDGWFRGLDLSYGPDGSVFVLDWCDIGECHEVTGVHRTSGRIYKIAYNGPTVENLSFLTEGYSALLKHLDDSNEWTARQAREQLVLREWSAEDLARLKSDLRKLFGSKPDVLVKLRVLWTLHALGDTDENFLRRQLHHPDEHIRTWAIRLLSDYWPLDTILSQRPTRQGAARPNGPFAPGKPTEPSPQVLLDFVRLGRTDPSGLVRLALASTLQRLPVLQRIPLATALLSHAEDAADHNLPLLIWYGLIPLADAAPERLAKIAGECQLPTTRRLLARRLAEELEERHEPVNSLLQIALEKPETMQLDIFTGLSEGLRGWRKASRPAVWDQVQSRLAGSTNGPLRERVRDLSVLFGDGRALDELKQVVLDAHAALAFRQEALRTLIESRPPDLRAICQQLLSVNFLNSTAVRGLALFEDPEIGALLAGSYIRFHPSERAAVIETLASRPTFAGALLEEIAAGRIPRTAVTAFQARQIRSFDNAALTKRLAEVWGELRDSSADKQKFIAELKAKLTPQLLASADKSAGRALFNTACAACHTLYGHGGSIGPDLTGSGRDNLDYLLDNVVDPSGVVNADFRMTVVDLKDDRTLNGLVSARTEHTLTLKTPNETVTLPRDEITRLRESTLSLMPEGLLEGLTEPQVRDLIAYLMSRSQVPLPTER